MTTQKSFQVSAQKPYDRDTLGGLSHRYSDCIACKLPKETVSSILENIANKTTPPRHESSIYTVSADWIGSLATSIINELSTVLNAPPDHFVEIGKTIANIVSCVGNGTWSTGITPINALKDIETNFPLYISDYFDQLSGWSRENFFEESSSRIGSNIAELSLGGPYPAENPNGLEPALSGKYVKISWKLPNIDLPFNVSNDPTFASDGEQVYRYFAFIDDFKHAISMNEDGSITNELYNFSDPAQLWRIENYGNFYALYNKKYKTYLGRSLKGNNSKPDNNWHESAVYLVEDPETHAYSIGYAQESAKIEYILKDLNLVTVPLVAWRNSSGQFLGIEDIQSGTLGFSDGEQYNNDVIPKSEQLFLFVPHTAIVIGHNGKLLEFDPISNKKSFSYNFKSPMRLPFVLFEYIQNIWQRSANHLATRLHNLITEASPSPGSGTRVRVWKADPSVKQIGIRELFLINTDITAGPNDSWFDTVSTLSPITPDENGDFLLTFDNTPPTVPESDNHIRFDVVHTFSVVRYVFNVLSGDLEYLDGRPPVLERPWGNDKRLSIEPHAGEKADAYYSRGEAALRFFYTFEGSDRPIYLCRSIDVVAHEAGHAFLDTLQPDWQADGQTGAFHEAFGDLCSLFVLISMAEIADLFITTTKANLRAPDNFLSAMGEEFGDALYNNKGKGLRNLSNTLKGSKVGTEVHDLSMVFSGFYYDVLADVFTLERNPTIKGDTETLMNVGANLRRALIIAIRVSSHRPTRTKFQEIATNLDIAIGTLGRKLGVDLTSWRQVVKKHAKARELSIAGR
ncbi:11728_t:CDS:10 [Funneliformis caledonium]|uniref:11728_t:CDS:1 n=1 Tax=Funneliformis caledonium TaxID=1117310 RepID=A0A9N9BAC5_9GLOM|nr:11728_t:CDS:10 [Funneliformis caledonium]